MIEKTSLQLSIELNNILGDIETHFVWINEKLFYCPDGEKVDRWTIIPRKGYKSHKYYNSKKPPHPAFTLGEIWSILPKNIISTKGSLGVIGKECKFTKAIIATYNDKEYIGYYDFTHKSTPCLIGAFVEIRNNYTTKAACRLLKQIIDRQYFIYNKEQP